MGVAVAVVDDLFFLDGLLGDLQSEMDSPVGIRRRCPAPDLQGVERPAGVAVAGLRQERQRVGIGAHAQVSQPALFVFDRPVENADDSRRAAKDLVQRPSNGKAAARSARKTD